MNVLFVIPIVKLALVQLIIVAVVMMDIMCPMENANNVIQIVIDALTQRQIGKVAILDIIWIQVILVLNVIQIVIVALAQQQIAKDAILDIIWIQVILVFNA